jgi:2-dehydropantoate 2-reductase
MRITIMGAGGVGGYFGGRLAEGGCDVGFVARGPHLAALRKHGLLVESKLGNIRLANVRASDNPADLGVPDFLLINVKLWDMSTALRAAEVAVGPETTVLSLQNGIQKEEMMAEAFGRDKVMGGVCYIASKISKPGVISHTGTMQRLIFGECDGGPSKRGETFLRLCRQGRIEAELTSNIRKAIWEKFVFLAGTSGCTTTMRATLGPICENSRTRAFLFDVMREVIAVGRASGVELDEDFAEDRLRFCDSLPAEMTSSMHNDLQQGRPLEVAWLSGAVVKLGKKLNVPTPLNRAIYDVLAFQEKGASGSQSVAKECYR